MWAANRLCEQAMVNVPVLLVRYNSLHVAGHRQDGAEVGGDYHPSQETAQGTCCHHRMLYRLRGFARVCALLPSRRLYVLGSR